MTGMTELGSSRKQDLATVVAAGLNAGGSREFHDTHDPHDLSDTAHFH